MPQPIILRAIHEVMCYLLFAENRMQPIFCQPFKSLAQDISRDNSLAILILQLFEIVFSATHIPIANAWHARLRSINSSIAEKSIFNFIELYDKRPQKRKGQTRYRFMFYNAIPRSSGNKLQEVFFFSIVLPPSKSIIIHKLRTMAGPEEVATLKHIQIQSGILGSH